MKPRRILHIDGDCFFASCEMALQPKLRDKPIFVGGGRTGDGIVIAANYAAKKFGIKTGMACFEARNLCPRGVLVRPHYDEYRRISLELFQILRRYTPTLLPTSIDEGFLDFTDMPRVFNAPDAPTLVERIRREIRETLGITVSAGLGSSRWLAKLATERAKPDGFREVSFAEETKFLENIPLQSLAGIASRRAKRLQAFGAFTLGDVGRLPLSLIERHFGFFGLELWLLARGKLRETLAHEFRPRTTISSATTLPQDEPNYENALLFLLDQAERVSTTFFRENLKARGMSLYIRFNDFSDVGCAVTFCEDGLRVAGDVVSEPDTKNGFANQTKKVGSPSFSLLPNHLTPHAAHPPPHVGGYNPNTDTCDSTLKRGLRTVGEYNPTRIARALETLYWKLMRHHTKPVRQVIIAFYDFLPLDLQADLFGNPPEYKLRQLQRARERIEEKYGRRKVVTGTRLLLQQRAPHLLGDRAKCPFAPQREIEGKLEHIPVVFDEPTIIGEHEMFPEEPSVTLGARSPEPTLPLPRAWGRSTTRSSKFA
jgi:DNA polymerase-4